MGVIRTYRDLEAWQVGMELAEMVYRLSQSFPHAERYGLTSQIQRAAVSIPANIAEGHARRSRKEFRHHVSIARGSLAEVETMLIMARKLDYLAESNLTPLWQRAQMAGRLINGLLRALARPAPPRSPTPAPRSPSP